MADPQATPAQLVQGLRAALDGLEADFGRMPFFVRPMARRSFAGRTGISVEAWRQLASALGSEVGSGATAEELKQRHPRARDQLERLAESFRTAPERAAKGMGRAPPELVESSRQREQAVRALLAWLG